MPPKPTARDLKRERLRKEQAEIESVKSTGSENLGEAIDAATERPYHVVKTTFKSAVTTYLGQPRSTGQPKARAAKKRKGKAAAQEEEEDEEDEDGSAVDIQWTPEQARLLDQVRSEHPELSALVQTQKALYKTFFRFMHCLPSDVVGPKTFLEFDTATKSNTRGIRWTAHFCERLGELVPQPLFRGSPAKLALAIQWAVIARTDDRRPYRLSGCADDGFLQCLTTVIADTQDGTKTCIDIRTAAATLYRQRYPEEGFAEPLWCQMLRHIEERTFPDGEPAEEAPENRDDPYLVHTEHLTTVVFALDRMQHLSLRMFTDSETVHATAAMSRRFNDKPLQPEAQKAWEAHLITWQRDKASRSTRPSRASDKTEKKPAGRRGRPRRQRSPSPTPPSSSSSDTSESDGEMEYWTKTPRKNAGEASAAKTAKDKPNTRASLVRRRQAEESESSIIGEDSSPPRPSSPSPTSDVDRDNDDKGELVVDDDALIYISSGSPTSGVDSDDIEAEGEFVEDDYLAAPQQDRASSSPVDRGDPGTATPRNRKRRAIVSTPEPPQRRKRQKRHHVIGSSSDVTEQLQTPLRTARLDEARQSSQIIPDSLELEEQVSNQGGNSSGEHSSDGNSSDAKSSGRKSSGKKSSVVPILAAGRPVAKKIASVNPTETTSDVPLRRGMWSGHYDHDAIPKRFGRQEIHIEAPGYDDIDEAYMAHRKIGHNGILPPSNELGVGEDEEEDESIYGDEAMEMISKLRVDRSLFPYNDWVWQGGENEQIY